MHNDSLKSTPLLMYEKLHDKKFNKGSWFYYLGQKPALNSFILDYRIRSYDYTQKRYASVHLGEWINIVYNIQAEGMDLGSIDWDSLGEEESVTESEDTSEDIKEDIDAVGDEEGFGDSLTQEEIEDIPEDFFADEFAMDTSSIIENPLGIYDLEYLDEEMANELIYPLTKDKIIFVGDFEDRDIHETIYGNTPGPIILLDAFLALEYGDNLLRPIFLILLIFSFIFISYVTLSYRSVYGGWIQKLTHRTRATFLESLTIYLIYFGIISIFSYFLFNVHIGVLILAFYMYFIEKFKQYITRRKELKEIKHE